MSISCALNDSLDEYSTIGKNPGPGQYNFPVMSKNGKYFYSKFRNSKCRMIAPRSKGRFSAKPRGFLLITNCVIFQGFGMPGP